MKSKFFLTLMIAIGVSLFAQDKKIVLNQVVSSEIKAGNEHIYKISANKNELIVLRLERGSFKAGKEVNLLITIYGPDEKILEEINTASNASIAIFTSKQTGSHSVKIRRWNGAKSGIYKISLELKEKMNLSNFSHIDKLLDYLYNDNKPGASLSVLKENKILLKRSIGLANLDHTATISDSTKFDIASLSKMFTAYAIAILIDKNVLSRTDTIKTFIPEFPDYGSQVTIHHLIHNLSGIKDYEPALALAGYSDSDLDVLSSNRIMRAILSYENSYFDPGTNYRYSNSGYFLLAKIIERATKKPFAKWMKENVFEPLDMNDTYINDLNRSINNNLTSSYRKENGSYDNLNSNRHDYKTQPKNLSALGASHVTSSLRDMQKWAVNYKTGSLGGINVLKIINEGIIPEEQDWDWYYGFQRYTYKGTEIRVSEGLTQGYRSFFSRFPEHDFSIIYLTNDGEWRTYYIARKLIDLFLTNELNSDEINSSYSLNKDLEVSSKKETHNRNDSELNLSEYKGRFINNELNTVMNVVMDNDSLAIKSIGFGTIKLKNSRKDTFVSDTWFCNRLEFIRHSKGHIETIKVFNNRDGDFFTFKKIGN